MPYDERENDTGRFEAKFSTNDVIEALETDGIETTSEVADEVGCAYRTAYGFLTRLEDEGKIDRHKVGPTSVWQLIEEADGDE